jgi:Nif-specific regulatory protein
MSIPVLPFSRSALLTDIARIVAAESDLDDVLGPVLRRLSQGARLDRCTLCIIDPQQGEIRIEAALGLTPVEIRRGSYRVGEGVTGQVAATGTAVSIPLIANEPLFLHRTVHKDHDRNRAYLCAPVRFEGRVLGTLSAFRTPAGDSALASDLQLLEIVATLLGPALRRRAGTRGSSAGAPVRQPANLIGRSRPMVDIYELMEQVAGGQTTVLLRGESGTGKGVIAKALHQQSPRSSKRFVKVNCAALPEGIVESELFGHERGAFTGASKQRKGRFELAHTGTIFLDEVGDLTPATQVKLLRVLQEREFERVGGTRSLHVDVRIIAATSRNLEQMVEDGRFRLDLYYRLNVFPIHLPPLRERGGDILMLTDHFVESCSRSHGRTVRRVATGAINMLVAYHWPGNVRELENCIERAVLLARNDAILGHHLPPTLQTAEASGTTPVQGLMAELARVEEALLLDALKSSRGNMAKAARALQITERQMGTRVKKRDLDLKQFRS